MTNSINKILIFSHWLHPGFEKSDLALVKELRNRGYKVTYAVASHNMYLRYTPIRWGRKKKGGKIYSGNKSGLPGFSTELKKDFNFQELETQWIEDWTELKNLIKLNDAIVLCNAKTNQRVETLSCN